MKLLLHCVAGYFLLGLVFAAVPTCTQIKTMQQAILGAMKTYQPLMPLFVRLGEFNHFLKHSNHLQPCDIQIDLNSLHLDKVKRTKIMIHFFLCHLEY